jgi:hypothetical protein
MRCAKLECQNNDRRRLQTCQHSLGKMSVKRQWQALGKTMITSGLGLPSNF